MRPHTCKGCRDLTEVVEGRKQEEGDTCVLPLLVPVYDKPKDLDMGQVFLLLLFPKARHAKSRAGIA